MLESLFKKLAGWLLANLLKKDPNTGVFPWSLWNFQEQLFLQNTSGDCICTSGGCFCIFLKKMELNSYFATLLWRTNFFFSTHRLMYKKSNSFVYKVVVKCQVFEITLSGCTLWSWKLPCLITWTMLFETPFCRYLSMYL